MSQPPSYNGTVVFFGALQRQPHPPGPGMALARGDNQVTTKDAWQEDEERSG